MKKKLLLLLTLPLLASCSGTETYVPKNSFPGPIDNDGPGDYGEENMTVNFYLDYSHSSEPIYSMRWYMLKPLGECPPEAKLTDANAADPLYPNFLGYSEYSTAIDEDLLWNFETDYKQFNVLNLYGIWVKKQEVQQ